MSDNSMHNLGKQIGDTVRTALQSGDLTKLSEIGTAVQNTFGATGQNGAQNVGGTQNAAAGKGAPQNGPAQQKAGGGPVNYQNAAGGPANYQNAHNTRQRYTQTGAPQQYAQQARPAWMGRPQVQTPARGGAALVPKGAPGAMAGLPSIIFGTIGGVTFGVAALSVGVMALVGMLASGGVLAGVFGVGLLASIVLVRTGNTRRKLAVRVRKYYELLAPKGVRTIAELAEATGRKPEEVKKDVRKALRKGMMPDVRMDLKETCLIWGEDNYKLYMESEKARMEREKAEAERERLMNNPDFAAMEAFKRDGLQAMQKLRAARGAVTDKAVAKQMQEIEQTTGKIFGYVECHPEKLPDTRKFMSYYLPTTIKVMEKYSQYEKMEVRVPSVVRAMEEIEKTLGTIDTAFQNLLESLYHEETMDVSTDMEVLQSMLEQEGLTGQNFKIEADNTMFE